MKTKELIEMLQKIDGDIPVEICVDLAGPFQNLQTLDYNNGDPMKFSVLSSTTAVLPEDIKLHGMNMSKWDRRLEITTYLPPRGFRHGQKNGESA